MTVIKERNIQFTFDLALEVLKYDDSVHYRKVWQKKDPSQKGLDFVAFENGDVQDQVWFIEVKDYRILNPQYPPKPSNLTNLPETVLKKVVDTIAGLKDAAQSATLGREKLFASKVCVTNKQRIVLHLEPFAGKSSYLFPPNIETSVLQKLKQIAKHIDPNPMVIKIQNTRNQVPWDAV